MRSSTSRTQHRYLAALLTIALVSALLITVSGTAPAAASGEVVQFELPAGSYLENAAPVVNVRLTYTPPLAGAVQVTLTAAPIGTTDPAELTDYTLSADPVIFPANAESGDVMPVPLTFLDDDIYEGAETLQLTIAGASGGAAIGAINTHVVTIANDDEAPTLRVFDSSAGEAAGSMLFTVTRTGETELSTTAQVTPTSGTATEGDDFNPAAQPISIAPGGPTASTTFSVPVIEDNIYEPTETFDVTLSALAGARVPGSILTAVGSIIDNDIPPTLSVGDVTVSEASTTATFTVTRTGLTAFETKVDLTTSDAEATAGNDYTSLSRTLTISPGGATRTTTVSVPIINDAIDEDTETFLATLTDPIEGTLLDDTAIGTIIDNDTVGVSVDAGDGLFAIEGEDPAVFSVVLDSEPQGTVTITAENPDGELTLSKTTLTFTPDNWDTPQMVDVTANEDGVDEADPHTGTIRLTVTSSDPAYDILTISDLTASIGDADALLVTISGPSVGAPGDLVTFSAAVNAGATGDITYLWTAFYLGNEVATGDKASFPFTPAEGGPYVIQVIVGDSEGQNPAEFIPFRALSDISGSIFVDDIVWLAESGITRGCNPPDNDMFCPEGVVTRGQMAAFLVRFLGLTDDGGGNTFTDDDGSIFEDDIAKLAEAGITRGCNPPTNTNYCPNAPVTREQMAAFLVRALTLTDDGGGNTFADDDGSIFEDDIAKLAEAGITRGCNPPTNTNYCPNALVTREQMAAFIHRADAILQ